MKINVEIKKDKIIYNGKEITMTEFLVLIDCFINHKSTGNNKFDLQIENEVYKEFKAK